VREWKPEKKFKDAILDEKKLQKMNYHKLKNIP
jgi:hypothetical protein